jgi:hypothetical protein
MRTVATLVLVQVCAIAPARAQDEPEGKTSVDTPAESYRKGGARPPTPLRRDVEPSYGDSAGWFVETPTDDLEEPLPLGTEEDFARRGYEIIGEGERVETVVDPKGQIYRDRIYQGIIPGIRDAHAGRRRVDGRLRIQWVGFQPLAAVSRIFFKVSNPNAEFEVTKLDRTTVSIFFKGATVPLYNNLRSLITDKFAGPITDITGKRVRGGVAYTIHLRDAANHLYRFQPPHYVVIDFER